MYIKPFNYSVHINYTYQRKYMIETGQRRDFSSQDKQNIQINCNGNCLKTAFNKEKTSVKQTLSDDEMGSKNLLNKWIQRKIEAKIIEISQKEEKTKQDLQILNANFQKQFEIMVFLVPRKQLKDVIKITGDIQSLVQKINVSEQISLIVQKKNRIQAQPAKNKKILLREQNQKYDHCLEQEKSKSNFKAQSQNQYISNISSDRKGLSSCKPNTNKYNSNQQQFFSQNSEGSSVVDEQSSLLTLEETKTQKYEKIKSFNNQNYCLNKSFICESPNQLEHKGKRAKQEKHKNKLQSKVEDNRILPFQFCSEENHQQLRKDLIDHLCGDQKLRNEAFEKKQNSKVSQEENTNKMQQTHENGESSQIKQTNKEQKQRIKQLGWYKHLEKLSFAQTELLYMGQSFNWIAKFQHKKANPKIAHEHFQCKAEIKVIKNSIFQKYEGICIAEKSVKKSRHHSAILCLAELYSDISGLWQKYEQKKKQTPSLTQPQNSDNKQILERWLESKQSLSVPGLALEDEQKVDYNVSVHNYVEGLQNCKRELYYFLGQNNKIFMPTKWKLKQPNMLGLWEAEGIVRYEIDDKIYEYRYVCKGKSKKQSEEFVSSKLLKKIYTDFPSLFKKYKKIKFQKGLFA